MSEVQDLKRALPRWPVLSTSLIQHSPTGNPCSAPCRPRRLLCSGQYKIRTSHVMSRSGRSVSCASSTWSPNVLTPRSHRFFSVIGRVAEVVKPRLEGGSLFEVNALLCSEDTQDSGRGVWKWEGGRGTSARVPPVRCQIRILQLDGAHIRNGLRGTDSQSYPHFAGAQFVFYFLFYDAAAPGSIREGRAT